MTGPLYIRREAYQALPLLRRALIELRIQQGEIAFIEDAPDPTPDPATTQGVPV
jgi:hypothetical protein